jgi:hypothetical protein
MSSRVVILPLPALAAAAPLDHVEAVTIVRVVIERVMRGDLPGVPSAHVIRLSESGTLHVEGPIAADGSDVRRAVQLLEVLLAGPDSPRRVPGALRLIIGRALGTLDLPPYPALASLAEALSRFAAIDPVECFHRIVSSRPAAADVPAGPDTAEPDLTITVSDIRRARRATGVPLSEISRRCQVPPHLLRELEWGYLVNWPTSHVGRRLIAAYARAAGLDEQLVIGAVWPLLTESVLMRSATAATPPIPAASAEIVIEPAVVPDDVPWGTLVRIERAASRAPSTMRRVVAALTIPALLAIGAAPALWHTAAHGDPHGLTTAPPRIAPTPIPEAQPPVREPSVMIATPTTTEAPVSAVIVRQSLPRTAQPAPVKVKRTSSSTKAAQSQKASRDRGPKKWGAWVLNKMGVRIVTNTEEQNP